MKTEYEIGDELRLIRNVRNDGTFPGTEMGELLVRRGSTGFVRNIGTFLQDQIIYSIHFVDIDMMIGCREEELIPADAEWIPSLFEFRQKVTCKLPLAINGEVIAKPGMPGEIIKVLNDDPKDVSYHVRFPGRTLLIPENALKPLEQEQSNEPEQASG